MRVAMKQQAKKVTKARLEDLPGPDFRIQIQ
jgi:hypothetical protein